MIEQPALFASTYCLACSGEAHNACRQGSCPCPDPRHDIPSQRSTGLCDACRGPLRADPAVRLSASLDAVEADMAALFADPVTGVFAGKLRRVRELIDEVRAGVPTGEDLTTEEMR